MFGMSFMEILMIAVIAVLFLGPEKLPDALVKMAKFFKSFKSSVNEAKSTFEQEVRLQELKEDTLKYKKKLEDSAGDVRKKLTFEELEDLKNDTASSVNKAIDDMKLDLDIDEGPAESNKKSAPKEKVAQKEDEQKKESEA